jgi:KaiC/GvpD/RAD55 family RecA-like ATPase
MENTTDNIYYRAFAKSLKSKRVLILEKDFFTEWQKAQEQNKDLDYYESIFLYNKEQKSIYFKNNKSLSGITDVVTDRLVFDFDSHEDVDNAREDANNLVHKLLNTFKPTDIRIYFSGNKGYHVEVHLDKLITQEQFKNIVFNIAGDLPTFDESINDPQRVFRLPLTLNLKTNKYKIPLTIDQFDNIPTEEIIELSNTKDNPDFIDILSTYTTSEIDVVDKFYVKPVVKDIMSRITDKRSPERVAYDGENDMSIDERPDFSNKPRHLSSAKFALQEGFFGDGERNTACMILAATYRNLGYSKEIAYNMIKATLRKRAQRMGHEDYNKEELWNEVIGVVYSDAWRGGTYSERENSLVQKTIVSYNLQSEYYEKETVNIKEISEKFKIFADNIDKNVIKTGVGQLDDKLLITTGMMVGVLGAPSSGKTTHTISIVEHQSLNGIGSLFVSADMAENLLYARLMQRYCGIDFRTILEDIKLKPYQMWPQKIRGAWDQVLENFKNVGFSFQSGPTTEDIARRIEEQEQITGAPVKALFVDYLEKLRCDINDPTQASGRNASRLADLTRDKQLATFLLLQPQKSAGDPSDELLSMRKVKGASVIEQDCRVILTTWRPGFNPDVKGKNPEDIFSSIAIVKNNMGEAGKIDFRFNGATGLLTPMTFEDEKYLEEVKRNAQNRKAAAYKATEGIYEVPERSNRNYTNKAEEPHKFKHKALPNAESGDKKNKDLY